MTSPMAWPAWLDKTLVWEASNPYLYFRTARDCRIIAWGEDRDDPEACKNPTRMRASVNLAPHDDLFAFHQVTRGCK